MLRVDKLTFNVNKETNVEIHLLNQKYKDIYCKSDTDIYSEV